MVVKHQSREELTCPKSPEHGQEAVITCTARQRAIGKNTADREERDQINHGEIQAASQTETAV